MLYQNSLTENHHHMQKYHFIIKDTTECLIIDYPFQIFHNFKTKQVRNKVLIDYHLATPQVLTAPQLKSTSTQVRNIHITLISCNAI